MLAPPPVERGDTRPSWVRPSKTWGRRRRVSKVVMGLLEERVVTISFRRGFTSVGEGERKEKTDGPRGQDDPVGTLPVGFGSDVHGGGDVQGGGDDPDRNVRDPGKCTYARVEGKDVDPGPANVCRRIGSSS